MTEVAGLVNAKARFRDELHAFAVLATKASLTSSDAALCQELARARQSLLEFLKEENERRGVTVLFSTHIFDGLEEWGTHVTYVRDGTVMTNTELAGMAELEPFKAQGSLTPLFHFVEATVRKDSETARAAGRKSTRGQALPSMIAAN